GQFDGVPKRAGQHRPVDSPMAQQDPGKRFVTGYPLRAGRRADRSRWKQWSAHRLRRDHSPGIGITFASYGSEGRTPNASSQTVNHSSAPAPMATFQGTMALAKAGAAKLSQLTPPSISSQPIGRGIKADRTTSMLRPMQ